MVPPFSHKSTVLRLIQRATSDYPDWILGKKALQKSFYFFNLECGIFSFRWADYGPLSGEIQQIARDLEAVSRIEITDVGTNNPNATFKSMKYVQESDDFPVPPELDAALGKTLNFVAGRSTRELELLASVHFWAKRNMDGDIVEDVYFMLNELKPDAGFTKEDVANSINILRENGLLPQ